MKIISLSLLSILTLASATAEQTLPAATATATATAKVTAQDAGKARQALIQLIAPTAKELAWAEIPWETDLTVARRKATAARKPLFLWEMDGHPLGCV